MPKFIAGFCAGLLLSGAFICSRSLEARKPTHLEIVHKIVQQNYYFIQKAIALQQYQSEVLSQIAEKDKVKMENLTPAKNRLQQEIFQIDLKIRELNK